MGNRRRSVRGTERDGEREWAVLYCLFVLMAEKQESGFELPVCAHFEAP